jgi:uncharacterized protein YndB with AHSA1/START domain
MQLTSSATIQIQKPIEEVYEGIINPEMMTKYFISESNGRLETGQDLLWKFPEFDERFPITEVVVVENTSVSFKWDPDTQVQIHLEAYNSTSTVVKITEGDKDYSPENLAWLISNTGGWSNFLACLKAYLEYGVQLRKGAYDFMRK